MNHRYDLHRGLLPVLLPVSLAFLRRRALMKYRADARADLLHSKYCSWQHCMFKCTCHNAQGNRGSSFPKEIAAKVLHIRALSKSLTGREEMTSERNRVLARLGARDAASLVDMAAEASASADRERALLRLVGDLGVPIVQARFVLKRLTEHLQSSDLTINFVAYKFFNRRPHGSGYVSQFEGGSKWGDQSYITARDEVEEAMFDYSGAKAKPDNVHAEVLRRVFQFGKKSELTFEPSIRPKYAALNYARLLYGSAGQWGKSHMVLKEHVKHNATYVHSDSFDEAGSAKQRAALGDKIASFLNTDRLIANMPKTMLQALHDAQTGTSLGTALQVPGLGKTSYIEAHIHGGLLFDRDIAKIVISTHELTNAETELKSVVLKNKSFKVVSSKTLRETFEKFARKYGIVVEQV
jgi:hypothetical protein